MQLLTNSLYILCICLHSLNTSSSCSSDSDVPKTGEKKEFTTKQNKKLQVTHRNNSVPEIVELALSKLDLLKNQ
jgi:hypothetical protein